MEEIKVISGVCGKRHEEFSKGHRKLRQPIVKLRYLNEKLTRGIQKLRQRKSRMSKDRKIAETVKSFLLNSSVHGLVYLANKKITLFERTILVILELVIMIAAARELWDLRENISGNPTVTTLEKNDYPIGNIDHPGIAICDVNKISRKKVAEKLALMRNISLSPINEETFKLFAAFYDSDFPIKNRSYAEEFYKEYIKVLGYTAKYDEPSIPKVLTRELGASCAELLQKCKYNGVEEDCSKLFVSRTTYEGHCCAFNYVRPHVNNVLKENILNHSPFKIKAYGPSNGLDVIINNNPEDYFFSVIPTVGVKVHIFNPYDFPDQTSGSFNEILCPVASESFLVLDAHEIYATNPVRTYSIKERNCVFDGERDTRFGNYTYSNCIVECKTKSMLDLCECAPFPIPLSPNNSMCRFENIACLKRYQDKWDNLYPNNMDSEMNVGKEEYDSIKCVECYPACAEISYRVSTNFRLNLDKAERDFSETQSRVKIYFRSRSAYRYKQDVLYYPYEIISCYGGILGIFIGASIISVVEVFYFVCFRYLGILLINYAKKMIKI